jgi:hypothetical protein
MILDPNVRAMSAAMLYGLKEFERNPDDGAKFLDYLTAMRQHDVDQRKGDFVKDATEGLKAVLTNTPPEAIEQRLDAASSSYLSSVISPVLKPACSTGMAGILC